MCLCGEIRKAILVYSCLVQVLFSTKRIVILLLHEADLGGTDTHPTGDQKV